MDASAGAVVCAGMILMCRIMLSAFSKRVAVGRDGISTCAGGRSRNGAEQDHKTRDYGRAACAFSGLQLWRAGRGDHRVLGAQRPAANGEPRTARASPATRTRRAGARRVAVGYGVGA